VHIQHMFLQKHGSHLQPTPVSTTRLALLLEQPLLHRMTWLQVNGYACHLSLPNKGNQQLCLKVEVQFNMVTEKLEMVGSTV
jgi:hypothetical protein